MALVTVLIADISSSREIEAKTREKLQRQLTSLLTGLNKKHTKGMISPLKVTIGDEFQAVFSSPQAGWNIIQQLEFDFFKLGLDVRYALVFDEVYTRINKVEPLNMDGPAFWKARQMIDNKSVKYSFSVKDAAINSTLLLLGEVLQSYEESWTVVQKKYVLYLLENKDSNSTEAARFFKKNPSTLYRMLKKTQNKLYQKILIEIELLLKINSAT